MVVTLYLIHQLQQVVVQVVVGMLEAVVPELLVVMHQVVMSQVVRVALAHLVKDMLAATETMSRHIHLAVVVVAAVVVAVAHGALERITWSGHDQRALHMVASSISASVIGLFDTSSGPTPLPKAPPAFSTW